MRVVVAMSGGVDSSVAASLLCEAGNEVIGLSLRLWDHPAASEANFTSCCSPDDLYDARRVAEHLGIPFYVVDARADFKGRVVDDFVLSYSRGETPSPCVKCNEWVKFNRLLDFTLGLEADFLATGHFARIERGTDGIHILRKALDPGKDQSYFLFALTQERLRRLCFPLGGMTKAQVREYARSHGLPTASKHESQELCFVPDTDYGSFLEASGLRAEPGAIVDRSGKLLGTHAGLHRYTIGQRKGLGIAAREPLYVLELDGSRNRLIVGSNSALFRRGLVARDVNWISGRPPAKGGVSARIRSRAPDVPVTVEPGAGGDWRVVFKAAQRAITPGQAVVFYRGDELLGGGWILCPLPEEPIGFTV